jgi:acetyl-CoA C-acetyltransferase
MSLDPRTPVLIGVGQQVQRPDDPATSLEPYRLMAEAVRVALADTGVTNLAAAVDWIGVVQGAWSYSDPAQLIADDLGFLNAVTALTTEGGQAPQAAVNELCARIGAGRMGCAVLTGGETIWSRRRLRRRGDRLQTTAQGDSRPDEVLGRTLNMSTPFEIERGVDQPIVVYPIFESAIRAGRGETLDANRDRISRLWERFNQVAVANPHAWRRQPMTAAEIRQPSDDNRMVGFPYTKAMNSNWDLDQASALIVCSVEVARSLGVAQDRWVFPWAGGHANDSACVSNRRDLHSSPAVAAIGRALFDHCRIDPSAIDHVDLYSCFPSAVQISAAALDLSLDRSLTVTGGLTFAGGPLNNYVGHSIATMADVIRSRGGVGLVTGNGGYATKHAIGLYRSDPPPGPFRNLDCQDQADRAKSVTADPGFEGTATIEGYTIMHDANGPTHGTAALRTPLGARTWARVEDPDSIAFLLTNEGVGRPATIGADGKATLSG